jgi:hypothetical protein
LPLIPAFSIFVEADDLAVLYLSISLPVALEASIVFLNPLFYTLLAAVAN